MAQHWLITGASSGIGRELALLASKQGIQLSLCGRDSVRLNSVASQCEHAYFDAFCLSDAEATTQFVRNAVREYGNVDVLVNCAGLNNVRAAGQDVDLEALAWLMAINVYAPIRFMQAVIPAMLEAGTGTIVNVLSTTCLFSNPGIAAYTASKAALDDYSKVMRKELRESGIKMLSVYPGGVDTAFRTQERPQYLKPESVARSIVALLCLPEDVQPHELVLRPQCEANY